MLRWGWAADGVLSGSVIVVARGEDVEAIVYGWAGLRLASEYRNQSFGAVAGG